MHSTQFSLTALVQSKRPNVPVFLIYAGIIHAIGLALLLPIVVTLPGPGGETAPETSVIDVQIVPAAPLAAKIESDGEQTSALPALEAAEPEPEVEPIPDETDEADEAADPPEAVTPEAEPDTAPESDELEPRGAEEDTALPKQEPEPAAEKVKSDATKSAKPAPKAAKKPAATRTRTAKPPVRRSAKQTQITPFNGAFSGLFTPGAPARRR